MTTLSVTREQADAIAWAAAVRAPGRPVNILPYRYTNGAKRPAVNDWGRWHGGGRLEAQPTQLWQDWARYAVRTGVTAWAVLPGSLGVVVVDVDAPHMLGALLDLYGETPVYVETPSGGTHLYYRAADLVPLRTGVRGPGSYDVKSIGGTAHAPGSLHPNGGAYIPRAPGLTSLIVDGHPTLETGSLYTLLPDFPTAVLATEWDKYHQRRGDLPTDGDPQYVSDPQDIESLRAYMRAAGPAISGRGGHTHTFNLLMKIGDLGASEDLALTLAGEWDDRNEPPWGQDAIAEKVKDAYRSRSSCVGWRIHELRHHAPVPAVEDDVRVDAAMLLAALASLE